MTNLPIDVTVGNLPLNFRGEPGDLASAIVQRLRGSVPQSKVLLGLNGVTAQYDAGPAFILNAWYAWDATHGEYRAMVQKFANSGFTQTLVPSDNLLTDHSFSAFYQKFPDASGTVAFLYDVLVPRPTVILDSSVSSFAIDGSVSDDYFGKLASNVTVTSVNALAGRELTVSFVNAGTSYTITWPASIQWPAGGHAQPSGALGVYTFTRINSVTYGELTSYGASTDTSITTGGPGTGIPRQDDPELIPSNYGGTGNDPIHGVPKRQVP